MYKHTWLTHPAQYYMYYYKIWEYKMKIDVQKYYNPNRIYTESLFNNFIKLYNE